MSCVPDPVVVAAHTVAIPGPAHRKLSVKSSQHRRLLPTQKLFNSATVPWVPIKIRLCSQTLHQRDSEKFHLAKKKLDLVVLQNKGGSIL